MNIIPPNPRLCLDIRIWVSSTFSDATDNELS